MCRKVPENLRLMEMTRIANESRPLPKKLRSLTCGSSAGQDTLYVGSPLSTDMAEQANQEVLRMCVTAGISFRFVQNPHFRRLLSLLQPDYVLPGAHAIRTLFPESCPAGFMRGAKVEKLIYNCVVQRRAS